MTDKKLTDEFIIKEFEHLIDCTSKDELISNKGVTQGDLFDLITRQQAEIERLNALVKTKNKLIEGLDQSISYAYDRAIKEFAERLKNKIKTECNPYGKPTFDYDTSIAIMRYIDNLVKEMVGDEK